MKELKVIENDLVPVYVTSTGEKVVYGTELYAKLNPGTVFADWIKRRLAECDAIENKDYEVFRKNEKNSKGGRPASEYIMKLDTAKEMAMLEHNETGKQVRRYFIRIEEKYTEDKERKRVNQAEPKRPSLTAVTSAAKFLTELAGEAGCDRKIQLLAAKSFYNTNGYSYQLEIGADKQYWDTVHIARQVGICVKSSGKPADKAVNEIIRRIGVTEEDYTDTWESKGNWQGTVRKYSDSVIDRVKGWIADNDYPEDIDYQQNNGEMKAWHVTYQSREVA